MSDNGTPRPEDHSALTAAEYVLGVLGVEQRGVAERRLGRDPAFAREVAFWEERLAGLADAVPAVDPPLGGWARIEAALARADGAIKPKSGFWHNLALWRGLALASTTLAAACIAMLIYVGTAVPPASPLLARLDVESGGAGFVAAANPVDGNLTIVPAALLTGGQQKSYELWVIPKGGTPHSLGVIDPARPFKLVVPPELRPHVTADSVLAVTLEPQGGSPTGQPTGPVIANGALASL